MVFATHMITTVTLILLTLKNAKVIRARNIRGRKPHNIKVSRFGRLNHQLNINIWSLADGGSAVKKSEYPKCFFCGSEELRLPIVGISLSMWGDNYSFCDECLKGCTADEFWESFFNLLKYQYPPKLKNENLPHEMNEEVNSPQIYSDKNSKKKLSTQEKERRKMSNGTRYKIMRRDGFKCVLCGRDADDEKLVVDHIHPIARGGKTIMENLRTLCFPCNSGKGTKLDTEK